MYLCEGKERERGGGLTSYEVNDSSRGESEVGVLACFGVGSVGLHFSTLEAFWVRPFNVSVIVILFVPVGYG